MEVTLSVDRCADLHVFHLSVPGCIVASTVNRSRSSQMYS